MRHHVEAQQVTDFREFRMPRTLIAAEPGPARLDITVPFGRVKIAAAPGAATATLTLSATTDDPALADLIDRATLRATPDRDLIVDVPDLPAGSGSIRMTGGGAMHISGRGTFIAGDFHGVHVGSGNVFINGRRVQPTDTGSGTILGDIEIVATVPPGSTVDFDGGAADLDTQGQLGAVAAHTTAGDVDVDTAATLTVRTSSGDIYSSDVTGRADVTASSGDVRLGRVRDITARTSSGDITISGFSGSGDLTASSGSITVTAVEGGALRARTSAGGIHVSAAPGVAERLAVKARSSVGRVRVPSESTTTR